jgi:hypothetical protein
MFRQAESRKNSRMKAPTLITNSSADSGNLMTETSERFLSQQLTRALTVNLVCLVVLVAFCTAMTLGSPSLMITYWNDHRAASTVAIMAAILVIPGLLELAISRWGLWRG